MRAVVTDGAGGPEVLRVAEVPTPLAGPGEVLIEVVAAGINRADILQRRGLYPPPAGASEIIGLEASGRIAALGEGVTGWRVGDECVALLAGGGYAEYVAVPAGQVAPVPDGLDLVSAAGVMEVAATVQPNLHRLGLTAGETLLVHGGSGGIGSFAIQYGRAIGARVLTTASASKLDHCRDLGADVAIDYRTDWVQAVKAATDGRGVDVVLDVMGAKYLAANVDVLARAGRIVVIGLQGGTRGELDLGLLLRKAGTITATSLRARPPAEKAAVVADVVAQVWPLYEAGRISLSPETRFPLADVAAAHTHLDSGDNVGKVLLVVGE